MSRPPVVILVRHGESQHHVLGLTGGWTDTPLTQLGEKQARLVAARLRRELGDAPVRVVTSDLVRAAQTAEAIAAAFGVTAELDDRLREHNNGEAANLTHDEARARWPEWYGEPLPLDTVIYPGSETARAFFERCAGFIDDLVYDGRTPIVVTHGGTLNCLIARWLGFPVEVLEPIGFEFHTASITVVRDAPYPRLERLNDTGHLTELEGQVPLRQLLPRPAA